jgi:hypothetical protein
MSRDVTRQSRGVRVEAGPFNLHVGDPWKPSSHLALGPMNGRKQYIWILMFHEKNVLLVKYGARVEGCNSNNR